MRGERYVALGLAHARAGWFSELARWSTSAIVPVEFLKCVTIEEVRARLSSGRAFSVLLLDGSFPGVDRDLIDDARSCGCAVIVVDDGRIRRDWSALGASAVLPAELSRDHLLEVLKDHAVAIGRSEALAGLDLPADSTVLWRGQLVAVTGAGGTGASTLAVALAQGLGSDTRYDGLVLLADLALEADQAMLHDAGDVVPGIQELVDAHRAGDLSAGEVRSLTFDVPDRHYQLLLGLRRHRDWVTVRPRAFEATLDSLRRAYKVVIADIDPDVEGEKQCGSVDIEERNAFSRTVAYRADVIMVVGLPGAKGLHRLVRVVCGLLEHGVESERILAVVNRAPRNPRARAELTSAYAQLVRPVVGGTKTSGLIFVPERRRLEDTISCGARMPEGLARAIASAVVAVGAHIARSQALDEVGIPDPVAVVPGSLGSWTESDVGGDVA